MATRLTGWAAIEFAEKNGCLLSKKANSRDPASDDVDIDEAKRIAQSAPDAIYVDFDELPPTNVG
jgi:hypothetical protein